MANAGSNSIEAFLNYLLVPKTNESLNFVKLFRMLHEGVKLGMMSEKCDCTNYVKLCHCFHSPIRFLQISQITVNSFSKLRFRYFS